MPIANPALNERVFDKEMGPDTQAGWAAPGGPATAAPPTDVAPPPTSSGFGPPPPRYTAPETATGGVPSFVTNDKVMTAGGTFTATLVLFVLLLAGGWLGWQNVTVTSTTNTITNEVSRTYAIAPWIWFAMFGALGLAFLTIFKPKLARITGPIYAIAEGIVLGAISALFNSQFDGIVLQAVLATLSVFAVMLFLYATRLVKVTERFRRIVLFSMLGIFVMYFVTFIAQLFGAGVAFWQKPTLLGIGISVVIVVVASMNLMLNFDFIERAIVARAPRYMEWYGAFGLMLALVWLYLEVLRLIALLRSR
jgi:uncharacterized YccA/Bax inhibitor family protein